MTERRYSDQVHAFANAPSLPNLPSVIDVRKAVPANPPESIQTQFVGLSYEAAFAEAESFVTVVDDFAREHGRGGLADLSHIVDFGSGWGRITRTALHRVAPRTLHALDVDLDMTALINTTLPGVNAMTISPMPPTLLRDGAIDAILAFSVFSHLSGAAHEAWAVEFGRLVPVGGVVAITVLDETFFDKVATAQDGVRTGTGDAFGADLATTFPDLHAAAAGFAAGEIQYASSGGGDVRTGDYYGWAVAPPAYVERVWRSAGFVIVEWVPADVLFPQSLVFLVKSSSTVGRLPAPLARRALRAVRARLGPQ